ncbi:hypothetical protein KIN20_032260 [Parelaphostrongylus tenuis]|uniref:Cathepsin propeptide inhibitor domain-containing protein n=1 Tax=Parelaphostrongylus tenuis TaxID=148309 RepID=A0AAD5R703_PARTN|nr:hypothetical protein KIN20_032260 [Parelaphostrongylus tenuis]
MKVTLAFATLVALLRAETFTMETRSMGSVKEWLIKTDQYQKYYDEHQLRHAKLQKHGSMPLINRDNMFVGNVTVGTPGEFSIKDRPYF